MSQKPEITELVNAQMPLGTTLGIRTFGGQDEVDATLEWAAELCTAAGVLHGGVLMTLADTAGAVCAFLNLPAGATTVTIESKTNFLGAAQVNTRITAESTPIHRGKTTQVWQTMIRSEAGKLCAVVTQTQLVLPA